MNLWHDLVKTYARHSVEAPGLKVITLAQWALESGWGTSDLAKDHLNFGGLKFRARVNQDRPADDPLATPVDYDAHDHPDVYCAFRSLENFIDGYWAFIDNTTIYEGWRDEAQDPGGYIRLLKKEGYAGDPNYVAKVLEIVPRVRQQIEELGLEGHFTGVQMSPGTRRKVAIIRGHNHADKGAFSNHLQDSEWDFNGRVFRHMETASAEYQIELKEFLRKPKGGYSKEIRRVYALADAWEPEVIVETHFNSAASNAGGTEMLYYKGSRSGEILAKAVQRAVLDEFGLRNRKAQARETGRGSTSLMASNYPTILTEPFFGSSKSDCDKILHHGEDALARAYLIGIRDALAKL